MQTSDSWGKSQLREVETPPGKRHWAVTLNQAGPYSRLIINHAALIGQVRKC
jgi:hypothetical protein